jgi:hypothetical protein
MRSAVLALEENGEEETRSTEGAGPDVINVGRPEEV